MQQAAIRQGDVPGWYSLFQSWAEHLPQLIHFQ
jgi:hypothetical protein